MDGGRHSLAFSELVRLSLRQFRVKPARAALTVLGMSIGFGVVLFLISLGYGLQYILIGKLVLGEDSLVTMEASFPSELNLNIFESDVGALAAFPNVLKVLPVAQFSGEAVVASSTTAEPALTAIEVVAPEYFSLTGTLIEVGARYSTTSPGLVVTLQTLIVMNMATSGASLGVPLNLTVYYENDLTGERESAFSRMPLPITGIIADDLMPPLIFVPPEHLTKRPPLYQSVLVRAKDINTVESVRDTLESHGYFVSARLDLVNQARKITNVITIVLGVFGITALIVSAIGMFNTMIVSFVERTYEIGVLKSLGATNTDVRNLFLVESAIMGFLGGTTGVVLGFAAGQGVNYLLNILANHLGGSPIELFITPLWFVALTVGLSVCIGLLSGFWPARRASLLSPKEAF